MRAKAITLTLLGTTILLVSWLHAGAQEPVGEPRTTTREVESRTPKFNSESGWGWAMFPQALRIGGSFGQADPSGTIVHGYAVVDSEGVLRISFVQAGPSVDDTPSFRLVVLDEAGKRNLPKRDNAGGMANGGTRLHHAVYSLDPKVLPPSKPAYIGAERRTPKAR